MGELQAQTTFKPNVHVRITSPIDCEELRRNRVPKAEDLGKLVFFKGTCVRAGMIKMLETTKQFTCDKCNALISVDYDPEQYNLIPRPLKCPGDSRETCSGTRFTEVENPNEFQNCKDYQEIRVQEQVAKLAIGNIPRSITVILEDDLVDTCKPGDELIITLNALNKGNRQSKMEETGS